MKNTLLFLLLILFSCTPKPKAQSARLIIGTATSDEYRDGIFIYDFDTVGTMSSTLRSRTKIIDPSFMRFSEDGKTLYSVSERGAEDAELVSFSYDSATASLDSISAARCTGAFPCHLYVGKGWAVTANYGGGSLSFFDTDRGEIKLRRVVDFNLRDSSRVSHLHCVMPSPDGKYFFATDLGHDSIYRFRVTDDKERLSELNGAVGLDGGSGPRHITFDPTGERLYLINELSGSVVGYNYSEGELKEFTRAQSDSVGGGGSADIHLSDDGRYLYSSNRLKSDGISIFSVSEGGELAKIGYRNTGVHPRNFTLSPDGGLVLVACRDSDVVEVYRRDRQRGLLSEMVYSISVPSPLFVNFIEVEAEN